MLWYQELTLAAKPAKAPMGAVLLAHAPQHSTPGRRHCPSRGSGPSRPRVQCWVIQKQADTAVARGELTAPQSTAMAEPESSPAGRRGRHHGRLRAHVRSFRKGKRQIIPTAHAEAQLWLSTSSEVLLICIACYLRRFDVAREVMVPGVPGAPLRPGRPALLTFLTAGRGCGHPGSLGGCGLSPTPSLSPPRPAEPAAAWHPRDTAPRTHCPLARR